MYEFCNFYLPVKHFNEVCRVCLSKHNVLIPIKEINLTHNLEPNNGSVENISLNTVFKKFCNIEVSGFDNKPQSICEHCINMVAKAFNFFQLFIYSNAVLDKKLEENKLDPEKSEQNEDNSNTSRVLTLTQCSPNNVTSTKDIVEVADSTIWVKSEPGCDDVIASAASDLPSLTLPTTQITKNTKTRRKKKRHATSKNAPEKRLEPDGSIDPVKEGALRILLKMKSKNQPPEVETKSGLSKEQIRQIDHENDIFNCRFCKVTFHDITKAVKHQKDEHANTKRCILCPTMFMKPQTLLYHVATHSSKGLTCGICRLYFESEDALANHKEKFDHMNTKQCPQCGKTFKRPCDVRIHMDSVHLKKSKYQCKICGIKINHLSNVRRHEKAVHENRRFLCQVCGTAFTTHYRLKIHMQKVHNINQGVIFKRKKYSANQALKPREAGKTKPRHCSEPKFECEFCPKKFHSSHTFLMHSEIHPEFKDYRCNICNELFETIQGFLSHHKIHEKYQCPIDNCGRMFATKIATLQHKFTHKKPFRCTLCSVRCPTKKYLDIHMNVHTGERPFACEKCGQSFKQKSHLTYHLMSLHGGKKPRQCSLCNKAFSYSSLLKAHMRTHSGEKPFPCPYCEKAFRDTVGRHKHVKKDHPNKMEDFLVYKEKYQADETLKAESEFEKTTEEETCTENDSSDCKTQ